MTKEEAIKYLQQLYPNGGHCWLDEQRMEAVGMAIRALQEESKKCMCTNEHYTDDDRKVLCEDCEERCEYSKKEEPVNEKDKLRALSDGKQHLGWLDDADALEEPINKELDRFIKEHGPMATLEKCAAHFAEWGKKHSNLSVSEELQEAANFYVDTHTEWFGADNNPHVSPAFKAGAKWQKEQMMKDAVDACVTGIRTYKEENEVDFTVMYEKGIIPYEMEQEVKVIVIKEN